MKIINIFDPEALIPTFVQNEIKAAQKSGHKYLVIVCDTFNDYETIGFDRKSDYLPPCDYPIYCKDNDELHTAYTTHHKKNMQEVEAIYQVLQDPNEPPYNKHYCLICGEFGPIKEHCHKIPPDTIHFPDLSVDALIEWARENIE